MPFEIVITKVDEVEYISKDWKKLFEYTEAEQKLSRFDGDTPRPEQYGYKETAAVKTVNTEILKQTVDAIDLVAVIKAINGIAS